jgi:hypothetical protein
VVVAALPLFWGVGLTSGAAVLSGFASGFGLESFADVSIWFWF